MIENADKLLDDENAERENLNNIGPYIESVFQNAIRHKEESGIQEELMECLRQSRSVYNSRELGIIAEAEQPIIYHPLSDVKRRSANAWISEIFLYGSKPPWTMRATPVQEVSSDDTKKIADQTIEDFIEYSTSRFIEQGIPPDQAEMMVYSNPPDPDAVAQYAMDRRDDMDNDRTEEAEKKVTRMAKKCNDQMMEGRWMNAMADMGDCCVTYGTSILKGPVRRMRKRPKFNKTNGLDLKEVDIYEWECINPFNAYPAKGAVNIGDGDFCERIKFTAKELNQMKKLGKNYYKGSINRILSLYPNGGYQMNLQGDSERNTLENDGTANSCPSSMIDGIGFYGDLRGSMLIRQGIEEHKGKTIVEDDYYEVDAIVIDKELVFCSISSEKLGRPLFKGTFYKTQGSWWGDSPMQKMRGVQRKANAAVRSMCTNMAMCSGPMAVVHNSNRLQKGFDFKITPWGVVLCNDPLNTGKNPISFFQPASNMGEFLAATEAFTKEADVVTEIPAYSQRSEVVSSAGRTLGGLAMLMAASARGLKGVVNSLCYDVLIPAITYQYRVNLITEDDPGIKGDCEVDVGGVLAMLVKEENRQRITEFLTLANNPAVAAVIGKNGIAEMMRVYVNLIDGINPDNIIPSKSEIEKMERMDRINAQLQQAENMGGGAMSQGAQQGQLGMGGGQQLPAQSAPLQLQAPKQAPQPTVMNME